MLNKGTRTIFTAQLRILFCIVLFEFLLFIFSGVSFSFLHADPFFSLGADPASWIVYGLNIPQFIIGHHWIGFSLDVGIILLLLLLIRNPFNNRIALGLLVLLCIFYISLMGYLTHRNYQFGLFVVFIPFIFRKNINKFFAFEATRYFLLFFYFSAAFLKLSNNSLFAPAHFSHMLTAQFAPYFVESNTGVRTEVNLYLINHITASYTLFLSSFLIEFIVVIGFFTKRFDKWLAVLILAFHIMSWLIMDIAPVGQVGFICLLFLCNSFRQNLAGSAKDI